MKTHLSHGFDSIRPGLALLVLAPLAAFAMAGFAHAANGDAQPIILTDWTVVQYEFNEQANANWVLSAGDTVATQTVNADPSILLSDFDLTNSVIDGTWRVDTTSDDDFMGFVFGFQDEGHFYLFDWKQVWQNAPPCGVAEPGMSLKLVDTDSPLDCTDLWPTSGSSDVQVLRHNAIPWADFQDYGFRLEFSPGLIRIEVRQGDTLLESWEVEDDTYASGKFGFYNYSQGAVRYSGFTLTPGPEACSSCAPGPHFIDQCGPFPPIGTDMVANNGAFVGIDIDLDCVRDINVILGPCPPPHEFLQVNKTLGPIDDSLNFPGTSPVDGHPTGPGLDVIDTEIVALCLTNGSVTLAAGASGPSALPLQPSLGFVAEDLSTPDPEMANSMFEVFFEVSGVPGGPLYNMVPLELQGSVECLPPASIYTHPGAICLPLTTEGVCSDGSDAGESCINDMDCSEGFCDGVTVLANLVAANHSVNVAPELCDGQDNNDNGDIDEGFPVGEPCSAGMGECQAFGTLICSMDGMATDCTAVAGSPSPEVCNSLDDDCDGSVDEGLCGDGFVDAACGEECDDDNSSNNDACLNDCRMASCGDGFVWEGMEVCDDGNTDPGDLCDTEGANPNAAGDCTLTFCGDGALQNPNGQGTGGTTSTGDEECDFEGELCNDNCVLRICGDGVLDLALGEECDDGNVVSGDCCSSTCRLEGVDDCVLCPDVFDDPVECTEDESCDILDPEDQCPHDAVVADDEVTVMVEEIEPFCGGEEMLVSHTRRGSFTQVASSTVEVCNADCHTECFENCIQIPLQECYNECILRCTNGVCIEWETECNVVGQQVFCDDTCFAECQINFDEVTQESSFTQSCGLEIDDLFEIREASGSCTGPLVNSHALSGLGTAGVSIPLPLVPGDYELCLDDQVVESVTVADCGAACRILIGRNSFHLDQGVAATLPMAIETFNAGGTYSLSLHRYDDDSHTVPLSLPPFLTAPDTVVVQADAVSPFELMAFNPQPVGAQTHWGNVILRAEGPVQCEAPFDVDIRLLGDVSPPVVACEALETTVWPPNHKMVDVGFTFAATDDLDPDPAISIFVTSDEHPAEALGAGGEIHCPDAVVEDDGTVDLRAERSGGGDGRVYVVTVTATDEAGNQGTCEVTVAVPHSGGGNGEAVDSGQAFDPTMCGSRGGAGQHEIETEAGSLARRVSGRDGGAVQIGEKKVR